MADCAFTLQPKAALSMAKLGIAQDPSGEKSFKPGNAAQLQRGQEER